MNTETKTRLQVHTRPLSLHRFKALVLRKIWLPRTLYTLIPFIYLFTGATALLSALLMPGWGWLVPYALLLAGISMHGAALVGVARYRGLRNAIRQKKLPAGNKDRQSGRTKLL